MNQDKMSENGRIQKKERDRHVRNAVLRRIGYDRRRISSGPAPVTYRNSHYRLLSVFTLTAFHHLSVQTVLENMLNEVTAVLSHFTLTFAQTIEFDISRQSKKEKM